MNRWLWLWLLTISLATVVAYGWDKSRANRGKPRFSEFTLCGFAAAGGSMAAWLSMKWFRHKTRKRSFQAKLVLATLVHGAWMVWWWQMSRFGFAAGTG